MDRQKYATSKQGGANYAQPTNNETYKRLMTTTSIIGELTKDSHLGPINNDPIKDAFTDLDERGVKLAEISELGIALGLIFWHNITITNYSKNSTLLLDKILELEQCKGVSRPDLIRYVRLVGGGKKIP